jgi:hypothetical protein
MFARLAIRFGTSLIGIAVGFLVSAALLSGFTVDGPGLVLGSVLFWILHIVVQFLALRVLIREASIALAGLLALASTIVTLLIVNLIVSGVTIRGVTAYVLGTLIIWLATVVADLFGRRMIRARRAERRA